MSQNNFPGILSLLANDGIISLETVHTWSRKIEKETYIKPHPLKAILANHKSIFEEDWIYSACANTRLSYHPLNSAIWFNPAHHSVECLRHYENCFGILLYTAGNLAYVGMLDCTPEACVQFQGYYEKSLQFRFFVIGPTEYINALEVLHSMQLQPKRVVTYTQINALSDEEIQNTPCFTNLKTVYANTLAYIEREDITKENIIPFRKTGPYLWVGTLENTWTEKKRRLLRSITGLEIKPLFITQEFYKQLEINCLRYKDQENPQKALDATSSNIRLSSQDFVENSEITDSSPEESFKKLILLGVGENASDIHIERTTQNTQIKLRIDGRIDTFTPLDTRRGEDLCNYIKAHTGLLSKNNSGTGTADSSYRLIYDTRIIGLRLSSISQQLDGKWEDKLVIRILDPKNAKTNLDETNLNKDDIKIIRRALNKEKGIILVTGPTGSGKSTTLFAAASELVNREAKKNDRDNIVYSLEDPIEYKLPGIFQVQANENNGVSFNDALRGLMRLDLDALLIQEIRDTETAKVALKASDTGHLVLSTLHTNDTVNTFSRLINGLDANREQVLNNVVLITAQRLYGKRCVYCRKQTESQRWYNTGCPECKNRGIKGRVAVVESLLIEDYPEIIPILKNELNEEKVKKILRDKGWKSYHDQAKELSKLGIIEF